MRLKRLALIAEIVGGVAIVLSLLFVGIQIRASNKVAQSAMYQENVTAEIGIAELIGSDPELTRLYNAAWTGGWDLLQPEEAAQAQYLLLTTVRLWEAYYLQYSSGTLSEAGWSSREYAIRETLRQLPENMLQSERLISGPFRDYVMAIRSK